MEMSQALTSSGVGGRPTPYFGCCANIPPATATAISVTLNIVHASIRGNFPDRDAVVVILRIRTARFEQRFARGLHIAGLVRAARLQRGFLAVPFPGDSEAREGHAQARLVELGR